MSGRAEALAALVSLFAGADGLSASVAEMRDSCLVIHDNAAVKARMVETDDYEAPLRCRRPFDYAWLQLTIGCNNAQNGVKVANLHKGSIPSEQEAAAIQLAVREVLDDDELRDIPAAAAFMAVLSDLYPCGA